MPILKIKGWDTGRNKVVMIKLLQETLGMDEKESKDLYQAIHDGKVISLNFEEKEAAADLAEKLTELDAKVEIISE
jgi:ribosomal protein L7/L12